MYFTKDKNYIKEKYLVILRQTLNIIFFAGNSTNVEDRLSDKESEREREGVRERTLSDSIKI